MTGRSRELSEIIQSAQKEMEEIRKVCKHEKVFQGYYEVWKNAVWCNICEDCGKCLGSVVSPVIGIAVSVNSESVKRYPKTMSKKEWDNLTTNEQIAWEIEQINGNPMNI